MSDDSVVEIVAIERHPVDYEQLVDAHLDLPAPAHRTDVHAIELAGWALGRTSPVRTLEVWFPEHAPHWKFIDPSSVFRMPLTVSRPDVVAVHPLAEGRACGFHTALSVIGMAPEFEWLVQVILENDQRLPLATLRARRQPLRPRFAPTLHPVLLTGLGRSGSTLAMRILAEHPAVIVPRQLYDTRAAGYWTDMVRMLTRPASLPPSGASDGWQMRQNPFHGPPLTDDAGTRRWLGRGYPELVAAFCQEAVEQLYLHVARAQGQDRPRYFAEKTSPEAAWLIRELYPGTREIFLVRDFRDLLASILAFDARRGFSGFGRMPGDSEADYVRRFHVWTIDVCTAWRRRARDAHLLRYEDLVVEPVETVRRALEYLDVDATPPLVRRMIERTSADFAAWAPHRTSPDPLASIGRWRQDLAPELRELCNELFADALAQFGYEPA
jgi:hypothetical protein